MFEVLRIQVHLFAAAAQAAQARSVVVEVSPSATLADVATALRLGWPALASLIGVSRWAIDHQFASLDTVINEHQEIALIPPVSGG